MKEVPTFTFGAQNLPDKEYHQWLIEIKQQFQQSQIKTAIKVNTILLEFYWSLGIDNTIAEFEKINLKPLTNRMTRIKLTFIVYGDMFDIDEFSKIINISPTEFAYKGDKLKFRISTDTFWKYSFKDIISLYVEDSLKPLKKIITQRIEEISSFMKKNNLKSIMRFKVETNKEPAPAIVFENNTINLLSKLNSSIDLDLYIYD